MARQRGHVILTVEFDDGRTDLDSIADAMDNVVDMGRDVLGDAFFPAKEWGKVKVLSFKPGGSIPVKQAKKT